MERSPMDLESRARWASYSRAKDEMFRFTDTASPSWVVDADDKPRARLNRISHLLRQIPPDVTSGPLELPPLGPDNHISDRRSKVRPPCPKSSEVTGIRAGVPSVTTRETSR
jgi:hypothetical protein